MADGLPGLQTRVQPRPTEIQTARPTEIQNARPTAVQNARPTGVQKPRPIRANPGKTQGIALKLSSSLRVIRASSRFYCNGQKSRATGTYAGVGQVRAL